MSTAEESGVASDFPVKKLKEMNENGVEPPPECISSVIPGWFSEISPMWPDGFALESAICVFHAVFSVAFVFYGLFTHLFFFGV
ncbi:hypothetical protein CsSME_00021856 [Camellia sinensis var. sinensis]